MSHTVTVKSSVDVDSTQPLLISPPKTGCRRVMVIAAAAGLVFLDIAAIYFNRQASQMRESCVPYDVHHQASCTLTQCNPCFGDDDCKSGCPYIPEYSSSSEIAWVHTAGTKWVPEVSFSTVPSECTQALAIQADQAQTIGIAAIAATAAAAGHYIPKIISRIFS